MLKIDLASSFVILDEFHDFLPEIISVGHAVGIPVYKAFVEELLEEPCGVFPGFFYLFPNFWDGYFPQFVD